MEDGFQIKLVVNNRAETWKHQKNENRTLPGENPNPTTQPYLRLLLLPNLLLFSWLWLRERKFRHTEARNGEILQLPNENLVEVSCAESWPVSNDDRAVRRAADKYSTRN